MIKMDNIEIKYGDFIAIYNLNLEIKKGEFFTFLGPSGCGKTTTLRALAGFTPPSKGKIYVNEHDITNLPIEKRNIGMVFQSYALFPTMNVYDNVAYGLKVEKKSKEEIDERVKELAGLVNLDSHQLNKNVSELSGGQQQRVAIARALAKRPNIVLFDEPLSNLDAKLRKQLREELKNIQMKTGMTAVYVTHDQEEALVLSDRIAVFNNGYIEQIGTPVEIYSNSKTEFVCNFIGEANKLGVGLVDLLNSKLEHKIDINKRNYIRQEKVKTWVNDAYSADILPIEAKVISKKFYGINSVYEYEVSDTILKSIEKQDGNRDFNINDIVTIYINPKDILSYEVRNEK